MAVAVALTLAEATTLLDPPMSVEQLRGHIRLLRWQPSGWRHTGTGRGHPVALYDWGQITRLHAALVPFMGAVTEGASA